MISLMKYDGSQIDVTSSYNSHKVKFDESCSISLKMKTPDQPGKCFAMFKLCYNNEYMFGEPIAMSFYVKAKEPEIKEE